VSPLRLCLHFPVAAHLLAKVVPVKLNARARANVKRTSTLWLYLILSSIPNVPNHGWEDLLALTERDFKLLQNLYERLDKEVMDQCNRCDEKWCRLGVNTDGVCAGCVKADRDLDPEEPFLFINDNLMDPGPVPGTAMLSELSQVEEMLISHVHCFVEVHQIRGQQYKYRGHVVNFLNNTVKVYNTLPLLPEDIDIIIIRPKNWKDNPRIVNQFRKDFRVRREVVKK
jgi:hypothetical protein